MLLGSILGVIIFAVLGCIALPIGLKVHQRKRREGNETPWYKQGYIDMGLTGFAMAVFFLLIGVSDTVPQQNIGQRVFLYVIAGIVFVGACICALYMVRYLPYFPEKERREP